jgi:hypothetical protein
LLVAQVEASKKNGFVFVIYNAPNITPLWGIKITPGNLEEALEQGINYKLKIESLISVEEMDKGEVKDRTFLYDEEFETEGIDPFD